MFSHSLVFQKHLQLPFQGREVIGNSPGYFLPFNDKFNTGDQARLSHKSQWLIAGQVCSKRLLDVFFCSSDKSNALRIVHSGGGEAT